MFHNRRLLRLNINFTLLALIAAWLLGVGLRTNFFPLLMLASLVLSWLLTDWLRIIELPRLLAYLVMLTGAVMALGEFFLLRQIDHLTAVAKLLIYVQIGVMFQKKTRHIYEQWGVFLLLQMIVASLVNDNLLYGFLLIPVLLFGCSTLLSYASYVSEADSGKVGYESNSAFSRFFRWLGRDHILKESTRSANISMRLTSQKSQVEALSNSYIGLRRAGSLMFNTIVFAVAFFYIMPRLRNGAYEGMGWHQAAVGFSGEVSLKDVGELLESDSLALKVTFFEPGTSNKLQPIEPPYIRGALCHNYIGDGSWKTLDQGMYQTNLRSKTPSPYEMNRALREDVDQMEVSVEEQTPFDEAVFGLPPFSSVSDKDTPTELVTYDWRFLSPYRSSKKKKYRFNTYCFEGGVQTKVLPIFADALADNLSSRRIHNASEYYLDYLASFDAQAFPSVVRLRDEILTKEDSENLVNKVLLLEDYLVTSDDFTYSLAPSPARNPNSDPIEDFVGNHRTGHCQYFASAMTMMLRSMHIPSRIILGFRPSEFNSTGQYLLVRQRHAHAWVEAFLPKEDLVAAGIRVPDYVDGGAWLRLDPTPPGEGSNAGGSIRSNLGQFESLQQLWQDYVMNVDSSNQPTMLSMFSNTGTGTFAQVMRNIEQFFLNIQNNALVGGLLSPESWFSWQTALGLSVLCLFAFLLYKGIDLLALRFNLFGRKRTQHSGRIVAAGFYRRVMKALAKLNLRRAPHQTPREFARLAVSSLQSRGEQFAAIGPDLEFLVAIYYRLRYGFDEALQESDWQQVEAATRKIESLATTRSRLTHANMEEKIVLDGTQSV